MSSSALDELKQKLEAVASDIFIADSSFFLVKEIGENSPKIMEDNYGELFAFFTNSLTIQYQLAVTKIFESSGGGFPLRSLPALIQWLDTNRQNIKIRDRSVLEKALCNLGYPGLATSGVGDPEFLRLFISAVENSMPAPSTTGDLLSAHLSAVKISRDKRIAHHEDVALNAIPAVTWDETNDLLLYAKEIVFAIGLAVLGTHYKRDGKHVSVLGARRAQAALNRLLRKAELAKPAVWESKLREYERKINGT